MLRRLLLLATLALASTASAGPATTSARADPAWDALFVRTQGWCGADGAYSVDLGDGRVLWLFGDTFLGPVVGDRHLEGTVMVNGTVAVHPTPKVGEPPAADTLRFYAGPHDADGKATAWMRPEPPVVPADAKGTPTWYWLADGVVAPGSGGKPRLLLFLSHMGRREGGAGVWNFRSVGGAIAIVDDFSGPPDRWRARQVKNPHTVVLEKPDPASPEREISWGAALWREPGDDALYVFGIREADPLDKQLLLARAPAAAVEDFTTWRFRTKDGWSADRRDATAVAHGLVNELSVDRLAIGGRSRLVLVQSEPVFGKHLLARTADRPEGPWSDPVPFYEVPGLPEGSKRFTYAGKAHAECSKAGELLVTYAINGSEFADILTHASVYRPYFVRVPLEALEKGR